MPEYSVYHRYWVRIECYQRNYVLGIESYQIETFGVLAWRNEGMGNPFQGFPDKYYSVELKV